MGQRSGAYAAGPSAKTDFNGDGYDDIAIGAPDDSVNGQAGAGVVNVAYGSSQGIIATAAPDGSGRDDQRFFQDAVGIEGVSKTDDKFGTDVAAGDFNGDGYSDLAMGAPGDDYATPNTGSVNIVYGSSSGLSATVLPDQIWTGGSSGLNEIHNTCSDDFDQPIETFGQVLASDDFNGDGYDDLAVGAPGDRLCLSGIGSVGEFWTAGSLHIIYGSSSGLAITGSRDNQFDQGGSVTGITYLSTLETGDFNNDGYDDLAAADPVEFCCSGAAGDSGGYALVYYGGAGGFGEGVDGEMAAGQTWDQDSAGIEDDKEGGDRFGNSLAAGDFNNDGYDDMAIGAPGQSGSMGLASAGAGAVNVIYGSPTGLSATFVPDQFFTQDTPNVEGSVEQGDGFGSSLAAGDFNGDGKDDLAIGVAEEDVGPTTDAGSSNIIYGSSSGLSATAVLPDRVLDQNSANVEGTSESSDDYSSFGIGGFGASMTSGDYNNDGKGDLAIGVPGEDVGTVVDAGSSNIIYGSSSGISATAALADRVLDQNSSNVEDSSETGDRYGFSLA